jgi:hypothetical protein
MALFHRRPINPRTGVNKPLQKHCGYTRGKASGDATAGADDGEANEVVPETTVASRKGIVKWIPWKGGMSRNS